MQTITVDMTPGFRQPTIHYSQNDVGTTFAINLRSRFGDTLPASPTVKIQATKPSGFGFSIEADSVVGSVATFTTVDTMTDEAGRFQAELQIIKDAVVIYTANFYMEGEANPHPIGTTDGSQETIIPTLTLLVERVEAAASSVLDMTVEAETLAAGSQATYSYDEDTNTATFGIPQGEAGAGAADVTASAYSSSKTYAVGDYVIHNSNLYRCTTAITTAEAFTAAHWTQVVLGDDVCDLKSDIGDKATLFGVDFTWIDGKFVNQWGSRIDYTGCKIAYINDATDLIGKSIHIKSCAWGDMAYIVSSSSWQKLLSGTTDNATPVNEPWEFDITIPNDAKYIQISYDSRYSTTFELYENVGSLFEVAKTLLNNMNEVPAPTPLAEIRKDAGLLNVFRAVGCIGDSLASGCCIYKNAQDQEAGVDLYEFSWGQYLARMTGNTYYNFSRGGWSTRNWLAGDYGASLAFDGNHACDAYVIGLGQNDNNQRIPVGTSADINMSDYTQNADTFYGNYGKIIQMIQARYPKAKIFVCTDPLDKVDSPENNGYNTAIRAMVTMFDNVYLLDLYTYGKEQFDYNGTNLLSINKRYAHFNAVGYYLCALIIATYIDWIMRTNPTDFLEVEFINTDYHYN